MIAKAKINLQKFDVKNADILHSELEKFPLQNNTVEVLNSNCTINHATNKQVFWNKVARVLKNRWMICNYRYLCRFDYCR